MRLWDLKLGRLFVGEWSCRLQHSHAVLCGDYPHITCKNGKRGIITANNGDKSYTCQFTKGAVGWKCSRCRETIGGVTGTNRFIANGPLKWCRKVWAVRKEMSGLKRHREKGWRVQREQRQSGMNNYSRKRSVTAASTTTLSQNAHWPQTEGMRGAINGTLQRSISHLFLASHQMWRQVKATQRGLLLWQQL